MSAVHTYDLYESAPGAWVAIQHAIQGGTYVRPLDYGDLLVAEDEPGEPRITRHAYTPPVGETLDELKLRLIAEGEARTKAAYSSGVPAHIGADVFLFDTRVGERAAIQWSRLFELVSLCKMVPVMEQGMFPAGILTLDKKSKSLATAAEALSFWMELMTNETAMTEIGSRYLVAVAAATTVEEALAVVDPRVKS